MGRGFRLGEAFDDGLAGFDYLAKLFFDSGRHIREHLADHPASESIFGYSLDEIAGMNLSALMPEPHRSECDSCSGVTSTRAE